MSQQTTALDLTRRWLTPYDKPLFLLWISQGNGLQAQPVPLLTLSIRGSPHFFMRRYSSLPSV